MKVLRILFEVILVLLVVVFFIYGRTLKIDADNQRGLNGTLLEENRILKDSLISTTSKLAKIKEESGTPQTK